MKLFTRKKKKDEHKKIKKNLEGAGFADYLQYLQSPGKIFWSNLLAGISRGFGFVLGMSVVVGITIWILSQLVSFPLIGEYSQKITESITEYMESTNYKENFENMEELLEEMNKNLEK